ncbi:MAG TPA: RNA-binding S4 domain-containing protein [Gemmatimonadales bacterium]|nr:RNA-binding S4 domain-containing protein [Gemmatimonadales bacterium]
MRNAEEDADDGRVRLDKWLWAARFFKTRSLAAEAIAGGKVQVNGDRAKRARPVQVGDRIRVRLGPYEHDIVVRALSARRGPATAAAELYEETPESIAARETLAAQLKSVHSVFGPDRGRPSKRDRREIDRLRGKR